MNYRKIWEDANGSIPFDSNGRRMEIHHIDGNRKNNILSNLKLLTIQEHYEIHYSQEDWGACQSIVNRMKISPKEKSKMCSELAKKRILNGTHHFQNPEFIKADSVRKSLTRSGTNHPMFGKKMPVGTGEKIKASHKKLVSQGVHHLQQEDHKNRMRNKAIEELANGTHPFIQPEFRARHIEANKKLLEDKTHPFNKPNRTDPNKILVWCSVCDKEVTKPVFGRFHKH